MWVRFPSAAPVLKGNMRAKVEIVLPESTTISYVNTDNVVDAWSATVASVTKYFYRSVDSIVREITEDGYRALVSAMDVKV